MPEVAWKPVPIAYYGARYEVSNTGLVRNVRTGRLLKPSFTHGYPYVLLSIDTYRKSVAVHIVVALAFIGPRPDGHVVNHKDSDRTNSQASNLEYVTPKRNYEHSVQAGRTRRPNTSMVVLIDDDVADAIRLMRANGWSFIRIERALRLPRKRVAAFCADPDRLPVVRAS